MNNETRAQLQSISDNMSDLIMMKFFSGLISYFARLNLSH